MGNSKLYIGILTWAICFTVNTFAQGGRTTSLPQANKVFSVYAYICLDEEELPVTSPNNIQAVINWANTAFAPIGMSFNVCNIDTVPDYYYRDIDAGRKLPELLTLHYQPNVINIYFTGSATGDIGSPLDGYAYMPGGPDAIAVGTDFMQYNGGTLIHQLGHFFGLYHTHETNFGTELVNRTNCQTTGDLICDTEADPYQFLDENRCQHYLPLTDTQGNRYARPVDNYMSFYAGCRCRFTTEQYQKMYDVYTSSRNYLQ